MRRQNFLHATSCDALCIKPTAVDSRECPMHHVLSDSGHEVEIRILRQRTMAEARMQTVGIIGLGYVGLPTASAFTMQVLRCGASTSQNAR